MANRRAIDWTIDDIRKALEAGEPENVSLEYKSSLAIGDWSDSKRNELSKDISAFANSAGGLIIIGICEVDHKPTMLDEGVDTEKVTKEAVESALRSRVYPRIDNLTIKEIPNSELPGHSYFVIGVPRSMRAPHMSTHFHRYYKRYNFECVPMEHYEIEDVRRRQSEPLLSFISELLPTSDLFSDGRRAFTLLAGVKNEGSVTARDVLVRIYAPRWLVGQVTWSPNDSHHPARYNNQDMYRFDAYLRDGAGPIPIFPKDDQPYFITRGKSRRITLYLPPEGADQTALQEAKIIAQVFADGMRMRDFEISMLDLLGRTAIISDDQNGV